MSGNDFLFQQDSAQAHSAAHMQQLNCCTKKRQIFCNPTCGLQTAQSSVLWITGSGQSCSIMSTRDTSIVWMWINWNGSSSMSSAVLNSQYLTRVLTSGKEDILCVFVLKEDTLNTACKLTMLILSISVTFSATCFSVTSLITKLCRQHCPLHSCSFYKVVH